MVAFSVKLASLALLCCNIPSTLGFTVSPSIQRPSVTLQKAPISHVRHSDNSAMMMSMVEDDSGKVDYDPVFNGKTTISLVAGQSLLVIIAVIAAKFLNVPNLGLGSEFSFDIEAIKSGALATLPLFVLAFVLDFVEESVPALQDVTKATQRSVLGLLGGSRKLVIAFIVSAALGCAAGLGEEMMFRGVLQSELGNNFGDIAALLSSAAIFGALHAVTPLYALLAGLASIYFGELYLQYGNLAVPIACHGLYDVGALMAAHITVSGMSVEQRIELANWEPPISKK